MAKMLVLLLSLAAGFVAAFSFVQREEIGTEVANRLEEDFEAQCAARMDFPDELRAQAPAICRCMKGAFDQRGLTIADALGEARSEMREIAQSCAALHR